MEGTEQSKVLRQLLKSRKLTQEKAARVAGLGLGFLSRLIRGRRVLEAERAEHLAQCWGLSPEQAQELRRVAISKVPTRKKTANERAKAAVLLGDLIRQQREANQTTAKELARQCGIQPSTWNKIEKGRLCPSPAMLARMAHLLSPSPNDLVRLFNALGTALGEQPSSSRSTTVSPLIAALELAVFTHNSQLSRWTKVELQPYLSDVPDAQSVIHKLVEELERQAAQLRALQEADPYSARLPATIIAHSGGPTFGLFSLTTV
jgi:transcriptional regulator with XRE-family HTH domain